MEQNNNLSKLISVIDFAAQKHKGQCRKDGKIPYINHPIQVANLLSNCGENDLSLLSAAVLHDTIEDTKTSPEEIRELFGEEVLSIVLEVTDDKMLSKNERKQAQIDKAPNKSRKAKALKLADKICNVKDIAKCPPASWDYQRRFEYLDWSEKVINALRGTNSTLENLFDECISEGREILEKERQLNEAEA